MAAIILAYRNLKYLISYFWFGLELTLYTIDIVIQK